jgi:hypothetical protein
MSNFSFDVETLSPECQRFLTDMYRTWMDANLSEEEGSRVNNSVGLSSFVTGFLNKNRCPNRYERERVVCPYTYAEGFRMKSVREQEAFFRRVFPSLGIKEDDLGKLAMRSLPLRAEWSVIPRWEKIGATYTEATQKILSLISAERKFRNICGERFGEKSLLQTGRAIDAWKRLGEGQSGDLLLVATQTGERFGGRSIRGATDLMYSYEFGLGVFAMACILLTHPKREVKWEQLHPECGGDYFAPTVGEQISRAPLFSFRNGELRLESDNEGNGYGCASGFIPQKIAVAL